MKKFGTWSEQEATKFRTSSDNKEVTITPPSTLTGASNTFTTPNITGTTDTLIGRTSSDTGTGRLQNKELSDDSVLFVDNADTTKKLALQLSGITTANTRTWSLPDFSDTFVGETGSQTLTNKTINADSNTITNIDNNEIKTLAGIALNKLASVTANRVILSDATGFMIASTVDNVELGRLSGVGSQVVGESDSNTLTNKAIDGSTNTITNVSLSTGVTGTLPIANGGTGQTTNTAAFDALAPTTTKGDTIVYNGTDNIRFPVGTDGQVLTADSAAASGLNWSSPLTNPMDSQGDIIVGGAAGAATKLDSGGANTVLVNATANTVSWSATPTLTSLTTTGDINTNSGVIKVGNGTTVAPSHTFDGDTDNGMWLSGVDILNFSTGAVERLELSSLGTVFNDTGADVDFRIESSGNANMLFVDAGNNRIGIGTNTPGTTLEVGGEINVTSGGITLPNGATTLDHYETASATVVATGESAGEDVTFYYTRIGRMVNVTMATDSTITKTGASGPISFGSAACPTNFRPTNPIYATVHANINGTIGTTLCVVNSGGTIDVYKTNAAGTFNDTDTLQFTNGNVIATWTIY